MSPTPEETIARKLVAELHRWGWSPRDGGEVHSVSAAKALAIQALKAYGDSRDREATLRLTNLLRRLRFHVLYKDTALAGEIEAELKVGLPGAAK